MTPFKKEVTPEQYANAKKHWEFLKAGKLSGKFDMTTLVEGEGYQHKNICGTVACSLGYAPESLQLPWQRLMTDSSYFISLPYFMFGIKNYSEEWDWCFSGRWSVIDNSPKGAGLRMEHMYEVGLPSSSWRQMTSREDYIFKNQIQLEK